MEEHFERIYKKLCTDFDRVPIGVDREPNYASAICRTVFGKDFLFACCASEKGRDPKSLLSFEPLDRIPYSRIPLVCVWRATGLTGPVKDFIESICAHD